MDIETRINKVEWALDRHDESIKELRSVSKELKVSLYSIHKTLIQIKPRQTYHRMDTDTCFYT